MKIEKLTKEQEEKLPVYRDKWLKIGLSTSTTDRVKANQVIDEVYRAANLVPPAIKIWLASPMQGAIGAQYLKEILKSLNRSNEQVVDQVVDQVWDQVREQVVDQVRDQVREQVGSQVGAQVWDQVVDQVRDQVREQVGSQVGDQVGAQVRDQVWDQVGAPVGDQVGAPVGDQVRDQVRDQVGEQVWKASYGLHDADWLGFYDFCNQELGIESCNRLTPLMKLSEYCGWWWPFEGAVIMTEKPCEIHRDEMNRLHNTNGLALKYSDGWGVPALHGVRVPEKYVTTKPDEINIEEVLKEDSAEVRMAVLGKIGLTNALGKIPHKIIDSKNGNDLIEFTIEGEPVRGLLLRWTDMYSSKTTVIPVPRTEEEFKDAFCDSEFPDDFPDDVDDCEQVRISTFRGFIHQAKQEAKENGKHWMQCIEWLEET